jgi:hypothetical protein
MRYCAQRNPNRIPGMSGRSHGTCSECQGPFLDQYSRLLFWEEVAGVMVPLAHHLCSVCRKALHRIPTNIAECYERKSDGHVQHIAGYCAGAQRSRQMSRSGETLVKRNLDSMLFRVEPGAMLRGGAVEDACQRPAGRMSHWSLHGDSGPLHKNAPWNRIYKVPSQR